MTSKIRLIALCILVGLSCFFAGSMVSMPVIFYPEEARNRTISISEVSVEEVDDETKATIATKFSINKLSKLLEKIEEDDKPVA